KQALIERTARRSAARIGSGPRLFERRRCVWIGNFLAPLRVSERRKAGELAAPSLAHRLGQFAMVIGEELKRCWAGVFLAHEDQRNLGRQELQGDGGLQGLGVCERSQSLAQRAIANLVV